MGRELLAHQEQRHSDFRHMTIELLMLCSAILGLLIGAVLGAGMMFLRLSSARKIERLLKL